MRRANEQHQAYLDAKRRVVLGSFWRFSQEVLGWKDLYEPLHLSLCNFVQDNRYKKRLILLPRGHLKSSVVTVGYSLWKIAQDPKIRILIANGTYPLAASFLSQIKDHIMRNDKFRELFGDLYSSADKWSESAITVKREESYERKEPTVTVFGIGGNLVSQHYDLIIHDDLVNRENIHTPDRIIDVQTFYKDSLDLVDNPMLSEFIIIGTRWHEGDLYGWMLDETNPAKNEFVIMQRTAVEGAYEIIKSQEGGFKIEGGDIIFPNKFSREGLEKLINEKGISEFFSQYMNDPVPSSEAIFKHEWKYYEEDDLRGNPVQIFISCDPAFFDPTSKASDLDYTAFVVVAIDADNNWYVRDIIRDRLSPKDILETLFELDAFWHPKTIGIESVAYQKVLFYMARDMMKVKGQFLPITELKHAGANAKSKAERIQSLEPRYAVGAVLHNRNIRHMATLEMELRRFPRGKTDDVADALASISEIARPPARQGDRPRGKIPVYPA